MEKIIYDTPAFINMPVQIDKLEAYVTKILPLENQIEKVRREIEKYLAMPKTVEEIIDEVKIMITNDMEKAKSSLSEVIERLQNRQGSIVEILNVLRNYLAWKNILENLELVPKKTTIISITKDFRENKVLQLNLEMQKLKKEKSNYYPYGDTGIFQKEFRYVEIWQMTAPNFSNPVDAGGRFLNENIELDKKLLLLYEKLELGKVKNRLSTSIILDGKEVWLHPGYYQLEGQLNP